MEENINIDTGDGHVIYGTLNYPAQPVDKLIIFVHGITGSRREHQFYGAARFFPSNGYATFRFNLYSREDKARVLSDISIRTQSKDLDTVIAHLIGRYRDLFLVGHSLGGPTVMGADLRPIRAIVLWDPSITPDNAPGPGFYRYDDRLKKFIIRWQLEYLVSKEMIEEWKCARRLIPGLVKPTRLIFAGGHSIKNTWKDAIAEIPAEHDAVTVEGATHSFDNEGDQEQLYDRTLEWLAKH